MKFRKQIIIFTSIIFITLFFIHTLRATPELSLWSGNRCSTCHTNLQGGGMRNEFGWKFSRDASYFSLISPLLSSIYSIDKDKYSKFDSLISFGLDFRYQTTRSNKTNDAVRKYYPMQASFYAASNPFTWLTIEGQGNIGPLIFPGQQDWMTSLIFKLGKDLPSVRLGKFQPSIGLRDCDMTSLDRRFPVPDGTESFIPPDYAEFGGELIYEPSDWLTVNLGMFDSHNLASQRVFGSDMKIVTQEHNPSFIFKAMFFPEWLWEDFPASFIGTSLLVQGKFIDYNAFLGYSITDNIYVQLKYTGTNLKSLANSFETERTTNAIIASLTYMPAKGIMLGARAESGKAMLFTNSEQFYNFKTNQYILNAKIILIPYLEIIPEYRYIDCVLYKSGRWGFQLHLFY